jgi:hypothetical protein
MKTTIKKSNRGTAVLLSAALMILTTVSTQAQISKLVTVPVVAVADLVVQANPTGCLSFSVRVTNQGTVKAPASYLLAELRSGSSSQQTNVFYIPPLGPGQNVDIPVQFQNPVSVSFYAYFYADPGDQVNELNKLNNSIYVWAFEGCF